MRRERQKVARIRGDDAVLEANGERDHVRVDNVGGPGPQEYPSDHAGIDEGEVVRLDRLKEPGQSGLPAAVAPHLRNDWGRCSQPRALLK